MKAVVWSKYHCPYCDQAKALLKQRGIEFEEKKNENARVLIDELTAENICKTAGLEKRS